VSDIVHFCKGFNVAPSDVSHNFDHFCREASDSHLIQDILHFKPLFINVFCHTFAHVQILMTNGRASGEAIV
jgi:hypothetical protein